MSLEKEQGSHAQEQGARVDSRRRAERCPLDQTAARLEIQAQEFGAVGENVSISGVLLSCDQEIAVSVTLEDETRTGRVVRIHNMPNGSVGVAVEFDPS